MRKLEINKSRLTAEELRQYEALIAKATVKVEEDEEKDQVNIVSLGAEDEEPVGTDTEEDAVEALTEEEETAETEKKSCKKSANSEMGAALARLEQLEKSVEMATFTQIAKKYAPLGENEETLAKTLYEMKKSNEESYNAYVSILDKSLGLVEKSGLFAEIGKSAYGPCYGAVEKIQGLAREIMKADTGISKEQAVAKAWNEHPELVAAYEAEQNA